MIPQPDDTSVYGKLSLIEMAESSQSAKISYMH